MVYNEATPEERAALPYLAPGILGGGRDGHPVIRDALGWAREYVNRFDQHKKTHTYVLGVGN